MLFYHKFLIKKIFEKIISPILTESGGSGAGKTRFFCKPNAMQCKAMKDDPQYREKILSLIQRDWGDSIAKQEQERSRLLQSWNNERLLSKASIAYEANVLTETVTDSASLLG